MVKKMIVNVKKSLGFQANGRLKPADESEYANKNVKAYECPKCSHKIEASKATFGEDMLCPNCGETMIQSY